jgi:hypothetical protein
VKCVCNPTPRTWWLGAAAAAVAAVAAYEALVDRPVSAGRSLLASPAPVPPAQGRSAEPPEGFESRWLSRRARAIRRCKSDPAVMTWPQMVTCVLDATYPEASPWTDPSQGAPWMLDAAALVEHDLAMEVANTFGVASPNGWQALLWIRGARTLHQCMASGDPLLIGRCVASSIYPGPWPPDSTSAPWRMDFWLAVRKLVAGHHRQPITTLRGRS